MARQAFRWDDAVLGSALALFALGVVAISGAFLTGSDWAVRGSIAAFLAFVVLLHLVAIFGRRDEESPIDRAVRIFRRDLDRFDRD